METISKPKYLEELSKKAQFTSEDLLGYSYQLLHTYTKEIIIPKLRKENLTISIIELTTCGLMSDLLTGKSGSSEYFVRSYIPYSNESKIDLGLSEQFLNHKKYGTVSLETAKELARLVKRKSNSDIGIAETGLLTSEVLSTKRTIKKAGLVFTAIANKKRVKGKKLKLKSTLPRVLMRHNIVFEVMKYLGEFLDSLSD